MIPFPKQDFIDLLAEPIKGADIVAIQRCTEAVCCGVVTLDPDLISHVLVGLWIDARKVNKNLRVVAAQQTAYRT